MANTVQGDKPLDSAAIIEALGDGKKFSTEDKECFASELIHELNNIFSATSTADPNKAEVKGFRDDLEALIASIESIQQRITQDVYDIKQQEFQQRQYEINIEKKGHLQADDSFRITLSSLFALASKAHELFMRSKNEQKRKLINFMFSNLQLRGEKLEFDLRTPFHLMTKPQTYQEWLPIIDILRTKHYQDVLSIGRALCNIDQEFGIAA